jgi:hypothetical protein
MILLRSKLQNKRTDFDIAVDFFKVGLPLPKTHPQKNNFTHLISLPNLLLKQPFSVSKQCSEKKNRWEEIAQGT